MDKIPYEQIQNSLLEKHSQLEDWLHQTPERKKKASLGPVSEAAVQSHLDVLEETLEKVSSNTLGVCTVCHEEIEPGLVEMDYTTCVCLGDMSEEESRHLESELELAQTVQQSLLPQEVPDTPMLEMAAFSRPAQIIGGDYFDFFQFQDGAHGLVISDVAGHGISASLYMAGLQAVLRSLIPTNTSPADVVGHVQRLLVHNVRFSTFVTLFLGSFEPATHILTYCNAGHNPPLLLASRTNAGAQTRWLMPTGAAVGITEGTNFQESKVQLQPGDILVLYTDGVTEAMDDKGEEFGRDRLTDVIRKAAALTVKELIQEIRQELAKFTGQQNPSDDMTLVVCRIKE